MKSRMPWFWMLAAMHAPFVYADEGVDAYRLGHYRQAATILNKTSQHDPIVDYYLAQMRLYGYGELKNDAMAMRYLHAAGEKNFLRAQQILARYELLKNHQPTQALYWFKKAADANDIQAQMYCAAAYMFGLGVAKNADLAQRYYIAAAKNGNPIAQFTLAENFLDSRQAANKKLGMLWLVKAVDQHYPPAQALMAAQYMEGKNNTPQDLVKAKALLDEALAQNEPGAFYQMGQLERAQNHPEEAMKWYEKALKPTEYIPALLAMGSLYLDEKGPLYNKHEGYLTILKAAQLGSHEAQLTLSAWYKKGVMIEADEQVSKAWQQSANTADKLSPELIEKKAVAWLTHGKETAFEKTVYALPGILGQWENTYAIQQNNQNAYPAMEAFSRDALFQPQFSLTQPTQIPIHEFHDMLVKLSEKSAAPSLDLPRYNLRALTEKQATESGMTTVDALKNMATSSADRKQYTTLFNQLQGQAILGDPSAQFDVAVMYQYGIGTDKNIEQALKFYQLAATQQDLQAEYNIGLLYLSGTDTQANYTAAVDWLTDAAFKGNDYAQYALARIYDDGYANPANQVGIAQDSEKALAMYHLASVNNFGLAQYRLAEILVRKNQSGLSLEALRQQNQLIKGLYASAVAGGVKQAQLPLAFYDAMDTDKQKQQHAFEVAKEAAESGNQEAALLLGMMYDRGIAVQADQDDALKWYKKASDHPLGAFILGTYMAEGVGSRKDLDQSEVLLQKAADKGFAYAYLNLAVLKQQQGKAFLPDLTQALSLGNPTAGLLLADYYLHQSSQTTELQQARTIYQQFAEKGDMKAQLKLGFLAEQGIGGPADFSLAQRWYTASAEQGYPEAQYLLGRLYQVGQPGQWPDYESAKKWYAASAPKYFPAAVALGFVYDTVDENYQSAREQYQYAAEKGDVTAAYNLALLYERGEGMAVDLEKAEQRYTQAADKGYPQAMVQLAGMYLLGQGQTVDADKALSWYTKAAEKGNPEALYQLGLMSETGVGKALDNQAAIGYYQEASKRGDVKATLALARFYQYGVGENQDIQKAGQLYTTLAQQGNPSAQYQLALLCFKGMAGCQPEQGKPWLMKAEANGSVDAARTLQWLNAQSQAQISFIESVPWVKPQPGSSDVSADRMYMDALNAWNLGNQTASKAILAQLLYQYPDNELAKRAYQQLKQVDLTPFPANKPKNTALLK